MQKGSLKRDVVKILQHSEDIARNYSPVDPYSLFLGAFSCLGDHSKLTKKRLSSLVNNLNSRAIDGETVTELSKCK